MEDVADETGWKGSVSKLHLFEHVRLLLHPDGALIVDWWQPDLGFVG